MRYTLLKNPKSTLFLCLDYTRDLIKTHIQNIKDVLLFLLIFNLIWCQLQSIHYLKYQIEYINYNVYISLYWLGLGVLSSIGLGAGLNTGLLFLFPFVSEICINSIKCGHTNFDIYGDNKFTCEHENSDPNIFFIFLKTIHAVIFWGIGTALGEVPPFYFARKAKLSNSNFKLDYLDTINQNKTLEWANKKMIDFIKKHGFYTILFFASWPNMMFDACGIACGFCLISFKEFISATIIGKAFIKSPTQAFLLIYMIKETFNKKNNLYIPDFLNKYVQLLIQNNKETLVEDISLLEMIQNNIFIIIWNIVILTVFFYFIKATMEQVADIQYNKKVEENRKNLAITADLITSYEYTDNEIIIKKKK